MKRPASDTPRSPIRRRRLAPGVNLFLWAGLGWALGKAVGLAANPGAEAVVVFNRSVPESKAVADHYAARRAVPPAQVVGLDLPPGETMTRAEFHERLEDPLVRALATQRLWVFPTNGPLPEGASPTNAFPTRARVRYGVLCYGVPLRIAEDPALNEPGAENTRPELRRNEAAVDSELAMLPAYYARLPLTGPRRNPAYGTTNAASIDPTHGLWIVARLDGPAPEIARGLVDKAIEAERDGLWGRAYFDLRGLTNSSYQLGDRWLTNAAELCFRLGFETFVDNASETFPASLPLSHVAFYAGWYEANPSGPFARPTVEFMPGAFAYHLHSYSAATVRSATQQWVGPLLAKGATATMGCVAEPYLESTPDIGVFAARFLYFGFSFGEAAYACQNSLSWQTTVVGDPLYRPFGRKPQEMHEDLAARHSTLLEWSLLRLVNLNRANGAPAEALIAHLRKEPLTERSAILSEKLADLSLERGLFEQAIEAHARVLRLTKSEPQRLRVMLVLGRTLALYQRKGEAFLVYKDFLRRFPDYPDRAAVLGRLLDLARALQKADEAALLKQELEQLTAP